MVVKKQKPRREKKPWFQSKQAAKIEDGVRFSVYMPRKRFERITQALEIVERGTLSGFVGDAGVAEAERIISSHRRSKAAEVAQ